MASGASIPNLPQFRATLQEYLHYTKRALPVILNTKGFYILRGAARNIVRADAGKIRADLDAPSRHNPDVTVLEAIIAARMRRQGRQLSAEEFRAQVKRVRAARVRSRGYLASGCLPGIKKLEPFAERKSRAPRFDRSVRQYGRAKGDAIPAADTWNPFVIIDNGAVDKRDPQALVREGEPGWNQAWADEIASMQKYIEEKIQAENDKVNVR